MATAIPKAYLASSAVGAEAPRTREPSNRMVEHAAQGPAIQQLGTGSPALTALAKGWRKMLFPEASDLVFADSYAQAVTFGLLIARARNITLSGDLGRVAKQLGETDSLIAEALRIITFGVEHEKTRD